LPPDNIDHPKQMVILSGKVLIATKKSEADKKVRLAKFTD